MQDSVPRYNTSSLCWPNPTLRQETKQVTKDQVKQTSDAHDGEQQDTSQIEEKERVRVSKLKQAKWQGYSEVATN